MMYRIRTVVDDNYFVLIDLIDGSGTVYFMHSCSDVEHQLHCATHTCSSLRCVALYKIYKVLKLKLQCGVHV